MLFSNQTNLTFSNFLEPLNQYNCSRIGLLGQGRERNSQDETLKTKHSNPNDLTRN
jgi:hypothetical protein